MVIRDGADEVALIIVTVCVRVPIVASSGGPVAAAVNTFQAEDEVFVCHVAEAPVLSEGSAVQPELLRTCSTDGPVKEAE